MILNLGLFRAEIPNSNYRYYQRNEYDRQHCWHWQDDVWARSRALKGARESVLDASRLLSWIWIGISNIIRCAVLRTEIIDGMELACEGRGGAGILGVRTR